MLRPLRWQQHRNPYRNKLKGRGSKRPLWTKASKRRVRSLPPGHNVVAITKCGDPWEVISKPASELGADLVVAGPMSISIGSSNSSAVPPSA